MMFPLESLYSDLATPISAVAAANPDDGGVLCSSACCRDIWRSSLQVVVGLRPIELALVSTDDP